MLPIFSLNRSGNITE
jgi:hypothetical protein